ncbi:MAG: acyclic terpene utilization AtuA family protein [Ilumatobacter sp.]|nr:acyclic terpene utilization AtuA family protein [Ilumatobacter sp.]
MNSEPVNIDPVTPTRVLVPTGMLGAGFTADSIRRGIEMGADAIAVDGGSTDSGPYYLGTATAKTTERAVSGDLRMLIVAAAEAGIPVIIGTCGTSGTDAGVDWVAAMVADILREEGLDRTVARIYSEQSRDVVLERLAAGRIHPLDPAGPLKPSTVERCEHIVGLLGHHPIVRALESGADVVLAGRSTDTAVLAAFPLMRGCAPGPTWHAAKTAECGGQCTVNPRQGGVLFEVDATGFTIEPLNPDSSCTPTSVAAHMLYENADPFRMREPTGTLDTTDATYVALDDRRVRVEGSRFEHAPTASMKLEGSAIGGYQSMVLVGVRDPEVLASLDEWVTGLHAFLVDGAERVLGLDPTTFTIEMRCYGANAVLGDLEPDRAEPPREVGLLMLATAADQATATSISKYANPYLLHFPLPTMRDLPSFAFAGSPAETPRGAVYEFVLQHVVELDDEYDLSRIEYDRVSAMEGAR